MNWNDFAVGFWHPFGNHGAHPDGRTEDTNSILARKAREVNANGWTLWSFNGHGKLHLLLAELDKAVPGSVFALCSHSKSAMPPQGEVKWCKQYQSILGGDWQQIPEPISVPHPFGVGGRAAAFKVKQVVELTPPELPPISIEWFSTRTGQWSCNYLRDRKGYPPRPEQLIRRSDDGAPLRTVRAILELSSPFLVYLR
jgi:hypothetical protein